MNLIVTPELTQNVKNKKSVWFKNVSVFSKSFEKVSVSKSNKS